MKYLKLIFTLSTIFLGTLATQAQTDDFRAQFEAFRQNASKQFNDFRDDANRRFAEFREEAWQRFHEMPAKEKPKEEQVPPVVVPDDEPLPTPIDSNPLPIEEVIVPPEPEPQPEPIQPIEEQPVKSDKTLTFTYCGTECHVRIPLDASLTIQTPTIDVLNSAWLKLSGDEFDNTIHDCLELRKSLQLSDWAYLNLIDALSAQCYGDGNEARLFTAFVYNQSGYKLRLARAGNNIYLLYATQHEILEKPYYKLDNGNYYVLGPRLGDVEIYNMPFPKEKSMSLYNPKNQHFAFSASKQRTLSSKRYPEVSVTLDVNRNLIDFYDTYPTSVINDNFMTRWAMYANTPLDDEVAAELYPKMRDYLADLLPLDAANVLLNWVQTAFVYAYDDEVWGEDRAFFAEESLYYPYCDCEDRSILFSRLVRDLLDLDVILVYYPGHLATAVCFNETVSGDYIDLRGRRFTIADPTYKGAPVGYTMPNMDNASATVILLNR